MYYFSIINYKYNICIICMLLYVLYHALCMCVFSVCTQCMYGTSTKQAQHNHRAVQTQHLYNTNIAELQVQAQARPQAQVQVQAQLNNFIFEN